MEQDNIDDSKKSPNPEPLYFIHSLHFSSILSRELIDSFFLISDFAFDFCPDFCVSKKKNQYCEARIDLHCSAVSIDFSRGKLSIGSHKIEEIKTSYNCRFLILVIGKK